MAARGKKIKRVKAMWTKLHKQEKNEEKKQAEDMEWTSVLRERNSLLNVNIKRRH